MKRLTIGVTEPSASTDACISTIEEYFDANPIKICQNKHENIDACLRMCDAVILAGGVDIHPAIYGENIQNDSGYSKFDIDRDHRELRVITHCLTHRIPLLGICRGHQMLGVYHGCTMISDLGRSSICHNPKAQSITYEVNQPMHSVELTADWEKDKKFNFTEFFEFGIKRKKKDDIKRIWINSFHHQAILNENMPEDITVYGTAPGNKDEVIVELMSGQGWISCQWHPEIDWNSNESSKVIFDVFDKMIKERT